MIKFNLLFLTVEFYYERIKNNEYNKTDQNLKDYISNVKIRPSYQSKPPYFDRC